MPKNPTKTPLIHFKSNSDRSPTIGSRLGEISPIRSCNTLVHCGIHRDTISRSSAHRDRRTKLAPLGPGLDVLTRAGPRACSCGLSGPSYFEGCFCNLGLSKLHRWHRLPISTPGPVFDGFFERIFPSSTKLKNCLPCLLASEQLHLSIFEPPVDLQNIEGGCTHLCPKNIFTIKSLAALLFLAAPVPL